MERHTLNSSVWVHTSVRKLSYNVHKAPLLYVREIPTTLNGFKIKSNLPSLFQSRTVVLSTCHTHTHTYAGRFACLHVHFCRRPNGTGESLGTQGRGRDARGFTGRGRISSITAACGHSRDIQLSTETTTTDMHIPIYTEITQEWKAIPQWSKGVPNFPQYLLSSSAYIIDLSVHIQTFYCKGKQHMTLDSHFFIEQFLDNCLGLCSPSQKLPYGEMRVRGT
jgi:hypothetical protein